jgi:hypothetical protein
MKKLLNRYELVLEIAKRAKEKTAEDQNPVEDKKNNYIKTINDTKKKTNYVLNAFDQVMAEEKAKKGNPKC